MESGSDGSDDRFSLVAGGPFHTILRRLGLVGPDSNYGVLNDFQVCVCSFAMLLGRLEIFTLLVVLTPAYWRK